LTVNNTTVRKCSAGGIYVRPAAGFGATASIEKTRLENNLFGLRADDGARVTVHDSVATGNSANGFVIASSAAPVELNLDSCVASNNTLVGAKAVGAQATIRINNVMSTNNATGLEAANGGSIVSFQTNRIAGNSSGNGAPTSTQAQK
jgi:hypothetical protein